MEKFFRRTTFDKVLSNKALNIDKNIQYDGINVELLQWFVSF